MPPTILVIIFVIHAVVFFGLYLRKKRYYQLILTFGFLFLISFYLTRTLGIEKAGLVYLRWTGIIVATIGTVLMIMTKIKERRGGNGMNSYSKMPMYIFVILLIPVLVYICYNMLDKRKPYMATNGDMRVIYNHSKEEDAGFQYRFYITASVPPRREGSQPPAAGAVTIPKDGAKVYWITGDSSHPPKPEKYPNPGKSDFRNDTMTTTARGGIYAYAFQPLERTKRYYFFMEVTDSQGNSLTIPENALENHKFFHVTYKQDPNKWGLIVHIFLMIVTLFSLIHAFYYAFDYLWNKQDWSATKSLSSIFWGWLCYGISAFPLGIWIEYEKYGTYWTGFPLGWDMTDSKTLFNFLYWMIILILMKGSIVHKDPTKNVVSYKAFAWLTIIGGVLTMVVRFAIGHGDI